jgi:hypothetical protein
MSEPITLKSGAILILGTPSFSQSTKLFKVICNELRLVDMDISSMDIRTFAGKDINSIKNALLQLLGSDAVENALFECAIRSTYNSLKITRDTFSPEDAREDYFLVAWEVIRHTLRPFGKSLASLLPTNEVAQPPGDPQ